MDSHYVFIKRWKRKKGCPSIPGIHNEKKWPAGFIHLLFSNNKSCISFHNFHHLLWTFVSWVHRWWKVFRRRKWKLLGISFKQELLFAQQLFSSFILEISSYCYRNNNPQRLLLYSCNSKEISAGRSSNSCRIRFTAPAIVKRKRRGAAI